MVWFVASIISVVQVIDAEQDEFPIYEDRYLISAENKEELRCKLREKINLIESAGECRYMGKPAWQHCLGVRKVQSIANPPPFSMDEDPPVDGTEVGYSFMVVKSLADAELLAHGKTVAMRYDDYGGDDERPTLRWWEE